MHERLRCRRLAEAVCWLHCQRRLEIGKLPAPQDLLARGLLPANKAKQLGLSMPQQVDEVPEFGQDVVINHAPAQVRYLLTKRTTQVRSRQSADHHVRDSVCGGSPHCLSYLIHGHVKAVRSLRHEAFARGILPLASFYSMAFNTFFSACLPQEEIQRRTGTSIVNKGRYQTPGMPPDEKEKPLFLRVIPGSTLPVPLFASRQLSK